MPVDCKDLLSMGNLENSSLEQGGFWWSLLMHGSRTWFIFVQPFQKYKPVNNNQSCFSSAFDWGKSQCTRVWWLKNKLPINAKTRKPLKLCSFTLHWSFLSNTKHSVFFSIMKV